MIALAILGIAVVAVLLALAEHHTPGPEPLTTRPRLGVTKAEQATDFWCDWKWEQR